MASCGIVAGAAALVLEKFPHYTPQPVEEYLVNQSPLGIVQTSLDAELDFFILERRVGAIMCTQLVIDACTILMEEWMYVSMFNIVSNTYVI